MFLDLKADQVAAIVRLNAEYTALAGRQQLRVFQVQAEISEEMRKETLDPGAIGIRYAEIEAIRRDLQGQLEKTRRQVQAQLTDAQKAKMKVLEEARKLQPTVASAECENLLDPLPAGGLLPGPLLDVIPEIVRQPLPRRCYQFLLPLSGEANPSGGR